MLLSCIGRLHGNSESGKLSALADFGDLVNLANRQRLLSRSENPNTSADQLSPEQQWLLWIEEEARRRTGYVIWVCDTEVLLFSNNADCGLACGLYSGI